MPIGAVLTLVAANVIALPVVGMAHSGNIATWFVWVVLGLNVYALTYLAAMAHPRR